MVAHLSRSDVKVANYAIMLGLRALWLEQNAWVFKKSPSSAARVLVPSLRIGPSGSSVDSGRVRGVI
jgi:hypothetical protein